MPATATKNNASIVHIIDNSAALTPQFVSEWRALSESARVPNAFWDPDFCIPAMTLEPNKVKIAALRNKAGAMKALAPFTMERVMKVGPKVACLWTHDYIPLGTPLVSADDDQAFSTLIDGIMRETGTPVIAEELKALSKLGSLANKPIESHVISQHQRAALHSDLSGEDYRKQTLSKQRRQGLDRRYRRLIERTKHLGPLEIDLCRDADLVPSRFEAFMRLEKIGWKGGNKTSLLNNETHATFARSIALKFAQRQSAMVATLKAGETVLAALALFKINGEVFSWKTTYDENYKNCSPGTQLLARFADPIMGKGEMVKLDSCAAPHNDIANTLWGERESVHNVVFSNKNHSAIASAIKHAQQLQQHAKATTKSILNR